MITRIRRPLGTDFNLRLAIVANGQPIIGATPTFSIQSTTLTSTRFNQFYDVVHNVWSTTPIQNPFTPVPSNSGLFMANVDQSRLSTVDEDYLVVMSNISPVVVMEVELWEFGGPELSQLEQLHQYMLAPRRELWRVDGDLGLQERCFDAKTAGREIIRLTSIQDSSGAQPEEIRTNDTDLIA